MKLLRPTSLTTILVKRSGSLLRLEIRLRPIYLPYETYHIKVYEQVDTLGHLDDSEAC